ncbi:unnamed protein product [Blepharisma stoltei]|uniref:Uncharacterized protein n=1 Tax=Blepharisma stoltei TaxID=1481888 RepID=A0AAU9K822_9CILI|nr:unnamed protein product [Blepharisma stoltei]
MKDIKAAISANNIMILAFTKLNKKPKISQIDSFVLIQNCKSFIYHILNFQISPFNFSQKCHTLIVISSFYFELTLVHYLLL